MKKYLTIIQWTLAGIFSAYTVAALWFFTIQLVPLYVLGLSTQSWVYTALYFGAGAGFLAGLCKAGIVEAVDYWNKGRKF